ncbi:MAG: peptidase M14 [Ruminococcaceae bacterium]|nr:peptidase M14 [Oscillospiraceae bacterium]
MHIISTTRPYSYEVLQNDISFLLGEYPFLRSFSIGQSVMGKEIHCLQWGQGEKKLFLNGAHHAMEWITSLLLMKLLETLSYHHNNHTAIGMLNLHEMFHDLSIVMCPMVNPDGVNLQIHGLGNEHTPLQKTRLKAWNGDSTNFSTWQANINGVDLNHNYDADFEKGLFAQHQLGIYGPAPTRNSGNEPESEPESKALAEFTRSFRPHIAVAYHSQGKEIYFDFNQKAAKTSQKLAEELAEIGGYTVEQPGGMADFSGYKDWVITEFGIPAFTIEVGMGKNPLPLSQFDEIYEDNLNMLLHIMRFFKS